MERGDVLKEDGGRGLEEDIREILTHLIVESEMSEGLKTGGEETTSRLENRDIGGGIPGDHGYIVNEYSSCEL
jgi:hypothetical protein